MRFIHRAVLTVSAAIAAVSCTSILGDDFEVVGPTGTGAVSAGGEAGAGGGLGGSGGSGGGGDCTPNTTSCADDATLRTCDSTGQPVDTACPTETPACIEGACVACVDGTLGCQGYDVVQCESGSWQVEESCTVGCDEAACLSVVDIGAGVAHSCAVLSNGTVRCWGYAAQAELLLVHVTIVGDDGTYVTAPTAVPDLSDAVRVQGGDAHSCALTSADGVVCWGWNGLGQLGDGTFVNQTSPVSVGLSGTAVDFAVGHGHACAALANGMVGCWGDNEAGQIGNGESGTGQAESTPAEIDPGFAAGNVAAGQAHSCVRGTAEQMRCWGDNTLGQLATGDRIPSAVPVGTRDEMVRKLAAGANHTVFQYVGQVVTSGSNAWGQVGNGSTSDSTVSMVAPTGLGTVDQIAPGGMHTCVIDPDDALHCWGRNDLGQVGNGESGVNELVPVLVDIGTVQDVAAGYLHTCALTTDGTVLCWGANHRGQLGTGDLTSSPTPTPVVW